MKQIKINPKKAFSGTADSIKNIHSQGRTSKHEARYVRIITVLMLLLAVFLGGFLTLMRISGDFKDNDKTLKLSIETLKQRVSFSDRLLEAEDQAIEESIKTETALLKLHLENIPRIEWIEGMGVLTSPDDNAEFYFVKEGSTIIKSSNAAGLDLTDDALETLLSGGFLTVEDEDIVNVYASAPLSDGYIVTMYRDVGSMTGLDLRNHLDDDSVNIDESGILIYNTISGEIYSEGGMTPTARTIYDADIRPLFDNSIDIDANGADYNIVSLLQNLNSYRTYSSELEDCIEAIAYYRLKDRSLNVLSDVFLPVAYIITAAFVLVLSAAILHLVRSGARGEKEIIRIGKKLALDKLIIRREISLFGIVAVIVTLILVYVSALTDISRQNLEASEDLERIVESEAEALENISIFKEIRNNYLTETLDKAVMLTEADENLRTDDMLISIAECIPGCSDITVFNKSGVSEASSNGYTGYRLGDMGEANDKSEQVLNADINSYLTEPDENDISYYTVKSRYNSGVIRFTVVNDLFKNLLKSMGGSSILLEADFGNADIIYYNAENPDTLYMAHAGDDKVIAVSNELTDNVLHDKYFGMHTINDTRYLLNIAEDSNNEGNYFLDALNLKYIFGAVGSIVVYFISSLVVLLIAILLFFVPFKYVRKNIVKVPEEGYIYSDTDEIKEIAESAADASESVAKEHNEENEKLLAYRSGIEFSEHSFINSVNSITAGCILMFLAYLIFGVMTGNKTGSLMSYLFSSKWERGINIFSLTLSVIIIFTVWAVSTVLRRLLKLVSQNAGPSGVTAYKLAASFIRFAALIAAIILVLSEFGVQTGSLLAGAGLTSAVIAIGAQSTVRDILSGLFIIFEGNFNVGDIVDINGWVGVIREIGVRTTCIESYGVSRDYRNVRVINNSDFNNVVNRSVNPSHAVVEVRLNINADEARVKQLFEENAEKLKAVLAEPLSDVKYVGVVRYDELSKTVRFLVNTSEANRASNEESLTAAVGRMLAKEELLLDTYDTTIKFVAPADINVHDSRNE